MISAVIEICTGNPKEEATRILWEIRVGFTEIRHLSWYLRYKAPNCSIGKKALGQKGREAFLAWEVAYKKKWQYKHQTVCGQGIGTPLPASELTK